MALSASALSDALTESGRSISSSSSHTSAYHINVELTKSVEVGNGGKIELTFPELMEGQRVEVHVVPAELGARKRPEFGRLKGLITIHENFDDPLPEFEDYV